MELRAHIFFFVVFFHNCIGMGRPVGWKSKQARVQEIWDPARFFVLKQYDRLDGCIGDESMD